MAAAEEQEMKSYLEGHSENIFGVRWPTQDGHADYVLPEVYGAISVLGSREDKAGDMKRPRMHRLLGINY